MRRGSSEAPSSAGSWRTTVYAAVALAMLAGAVVLIGMYVLIPRIATVDAGSKLSQAQRLTAAFATATALGAIAALVVNTRRQALAEREARLVEQRDARDVDLARSRQFTERFAAAATQLGRPTAAERIAGVYAVSTLADDYPTKRQQCLDVLCGYLRLPWTPTLDDVESVTREQSISEPNGQVRTERTVSTFAAHDREVRATIVEAIRVHLLDPSSPTSWSNLTLDLRGAHLVDARFVNAVFAGNYTSFFGATFSGERATFLGAKFRGRVTTFRRATFEAAHTSFAQAEFTGHDVSFRQARFMSDETMFHGAVVESESFSFKQVLFSAGTLTFSGARFDGNHMSLDSASFGGSKPNFNGATRHAEPYDPTRAGG